MDSQLLATGIEQARYAAVCQQLFGQRKHIFTGHAGAQQDGQQLHIAERLRSALEQFFARSRLGWQVFDAHGGSSLERPGPDLLGVLAGFLQ